MTALLDRFIRVRRPRPVPAVAPGVYAYERERDGQLARLHLRADAASGVLVVNAALAARLSASGVFLAKKLLDGDDTDQIVQQALKNFKDARPDAVRDDIARLRALIDDVGDRGLTYPVFRLRNTGPDGLIDPLDKPIAADIGYDTAESLEPLLRRLWEQALVHVVFVVPDRFAHGELCRLVELAEDLGMIAGVRGAATALAGGTLVADLVLAGVDHVNVFYLSVDRAIHDSLMGDGDQAAALKAIEQLRVNEICPVAEIALLEDNLPDIEATLDQLRASGVDNVAFFALATDGPADADRRGALSPDDLLQTAATAEEMVERFDLDGTWYAPVLRDPALGLGEQIRRGPRASGDSAIRVAANGDVYLARGPAELAGNLLEQDWEDIRQGTVFAGFAARVGTPTQCDACPGLAICAADCPRSRLGWSIGGGT